MPFLLAVDLPIDAEEVPIQQAEPFDATYEVVPIVLEGSVENFDPVARAVNLSKTFPRKLCGTYNSFDDGSKSDVILTFSLVRPIGQIVDLRGKMIIGKFITEVQGNLNAKSDQLELIPLNSQLVAGMNSGGNFMGLQGTNLSGWNSLNFTNQGGRLDLKKSCLGKTSSKSPTVRFSW